MYYKRVPERFEHAIVFAVGSRRVRRGAERLPGGSTSCDVIRRELIVIVKVWNASPSFVGITSIGMSWISLAKALAL